MPRPVKAALPVDFVRQKLDFMGVGEEGGIWDGGWVLGVVGGWG
jgi:hypothetical protein